MRYFTLHNINGFIDVIDVIVCAVPAISSSYLLNNMTFVQSLRRVMLTSVAETFLWYETESVYVVAET